MNIFWGLFVGLARACLPRLRGMPRAQKTSGPAWPKAGPLPTASLNSPLPSSPDVPVSFGSKVVGQGFLSDSARRLPTTACFELDFQMADVALTVQCPLQAMFCDRFGPWLLRAISISISCMLAAQRVPAMRHCAAPAQQKFVQMGRRNHLCKGHSARAPVQLAVPINS